MTAVWAACAAFVLFVGGVWGMQERLTRRPGEWQCPACGERVSASMGEHMRVEHGREPGRI